MPDPLRKDVTGETLDAHLAKLFDTDASADRLSRDLLTSSSFMALIATFYDDKQTPSLRARID